MKKKIVLIMMLLASIFTCYTAEVAVAPINNVSTVSAEKYLYNNTNYPFIVYKASSMATYYLDRSSIVVKSNEVMSMIEFAILVFLLVLDLDLVGFIFTACYLNKFSLSSQGKPAFLSIAFILGSSYFWNFLAPILVRAKYNESFSVSTFLSVVCPLLSARHT